MQCTSPKAKYLEDGTLWKMEDMIRLGAKLKNGQTQLGIKQQPWLPLIPLKNYMVPLLHCEIGIGNQLLDKLHDIIDEHIENYGPEDASTRSSIPVLRNIISSTTTLRDAWDASADGGKRLKALTRTVTAYRPHQEGEITDGGDMVKQEQTQALETTELQALNDFRKKTYADKLQKARRALADQQIKLKGM
jgi:hypothetical protein